MTTTTFAISIDDGPGRAASAPPSSSSPTPSATRELNDARLLFIEVWGQMGSKWGIPRSMAEVHALLFIEGRPMNTDDVMERLGISRGNASTTLRALIDWGIVRKTHHPGDRKEYFLAEQDVWRMFRTIVRERKKREIDPLLDRLHDCRTGGEGDAASRAHNERVADLIEIMQVADAISRRFVSPTGKGLKLAARILARAAS
ncbi:MAG: GbsR/MarR family transcriptional regulator [Phycisphaerales bacterium]